MKRILTNHGMAKDLSKRLLVLAAGVLFGLTAAIAQNPSRVTGTVRDESGAPLAGAQVVEVGTTIGTTTNARGTFSLRVGSPDAKLSISFLGMKTQTVGFVEGQDLSVVMQNDAAMLDEVVAIGYGTARKSDLTGSVVSIKSDDMENRLVSSMEDALRGRVPGVTITSTDGQPGEALNIRIRGTGSLNASNSPLYVVDGVPYDEAPEISPNDVQSINILKDASSTAIYGSRGANGVVIITTKQGQKGKARVNVQYTAGVQNPVRLIDMANNWQYSEKMYLAHFNGVEVNGIADPKASSNWPAQSVSYMDQEGNLWNYRAMATSDGNGNVIAGGQFGDWDLIRQGIQPKPNTDWQRNMLRKTWQNDLRLSVTGGTDDTKYSIMGSLLSYDGMVINSGFSKYNLRANLSQKMTNKLSVNFNVSGTKSKQNGAITDDAGGTLMNMLTQKPTKLLNFTNEEDPDDDTTGEAIGINNNPYYQAWNIINNTYKDQIMGKLSLDWDITRTLKLTVSGNYTWNLSTKEKYTPNNVAAAQNQIGKLTNVRTDKQGWVNDNLLYWKPAPIGKHSFDLMAGLSLEETNTKGMTTQVQNFVFQDLKENGANFGQTPLYPTAANTRRRMVSVLGRANYNYANKYLATFTFRADGVSVFGYTKQWGGFPSAALGWNINQEDFMRSARWIDQLKLRASVGVAGNPAIPPYQTLPEVDVIMTTMSGGNNAVATGFVKDRIASPNLKWERSTMWNLGTDFSMFKNRISGTVELYDKVTSDLLLITPMVAYSGSTEQWTNAGKVSNKGLEIALSGTVFNYKDWGWDLGYNMSFNRSKVLSLGGKNDIYLSPNGTATDFAILRVGEPIGSWYGYRTAGIYKSMADVYSWPVDYAHGYYKPGPDVTILNANATGNYIMPGLVKYVDVAGKLNEDGSDAGPDGRIDSRDRVIIGCGQPKFTGGFQSNLRYKNLSLAVGLEFSYGRDIYNSTGANIQSGNANNNVSLNYFNNMWTPWLVNTPASGGAPSPLPGNDNGKYSMPFFSLGTYNSYMQDVHLEDGSYLRISDVVLSYNFGKTVLAKAKLTNLKVFVGVKNLHVFTKYSGYDPDVSTASGNLSDLVPGVDNASYPRARTWNMGINVTF